jgi:DNA polymerase III gamma/tau subunit
MSELYKKHRPQALPRLRGQQTATTTLGKLLAKHQCPHALLLSGPSGTGKTTTARILQVALRCHNMDYREINCADFTGIDTVRDIRATMSLAPVGGSKIWVIDEAHQLSTAAQNALLKLLEDTPAHVYFILITTDPQKIIRTIHTRCTQLVYKLLSETDLSHVVESVAAREHVELDDEVVEAIVAAAEGSARLALVILDAVRNIQDKEAQLAAIEQPTANKQAIELFKVLMVPKTKWAAVASVLRGIDEDPERVRRLLLACARNALLANRNAPRAFCILDSFRDTTFNTGAAGLAMAAYEVCVGTQ